MDNFIPTIVILSVMSFVPFVAYAHGSTTTVAPAGS